MRGPSDRTGPSATPRKGSLETAQGTLDHPSPERSHSSSLYSLGDNSGQALVQVPDIGPVRIRPELVEDGNSNLIEKRHDPESLDGRTIIAPALRPFCHGQLKVEVQQKRNPLGRSKDFPEPAITGHVSLQEPHRVGVQWRLLRKGRGHPC